MGIMLSPKLYKTTMSCLLHWCPACKAPHQFIITGPWSWDGNVEAPSFVPSILIYGHVDDDPAKARVTLCHSFTKNGKIEFLGDCPHELKGQTVDIPDWPWTHQDTGELDA